MWIELQLPEEVIAALGPIEESERGPSEISIAIEAIGTVSSVATVAQVVGAAPELARRVRSWLQSRRGDASAPAYLVIETPEVHVKMELPENVPSQRIVTALLEALASVADEPPKSGGRPARHERREPAGATPELASPRESNAVPD